MILNIMAKLDYEYLKSGKNGLHDHCPFAEGFHVFMCDLEYGCDQLCGKLFPEVSESIGTDYHHPCPCELNELSLRYIADTFWEYLEKAQCLTGKE